MFILKNFISYDHTQFNSVVKIVRTDHGTDEVFNKNLTQFLDSVGVIQQSSCAGTPQLNGVAEKKHRHLVDVARALRINSSSSTSLFLG